MSIDITLNYSDEDVWSSICGSAWESWPWWYDLKYDGGDWDKPCALWVTVENPFDSDYGDCLTAVVTISDIKRALNELSGHPYVRQAIMHELDFDAVYGDAVMQQAIFGEIIFG